jgi:hypothetical protein
VEQIAVPVVLCHRLPDRLGFLDATRVLRAFLLIDPASHSGSSTNRTMTVDAFRKRS